MREQWPTWIGSAWSIKTAEAGDSRRRVPPARAGRQREREQRGGVGLLSQREEETLRVAVGADVHKTAPESALAPGAAPPRQQAHAQECGGCCVGQKPEPAARGLWWFSGHLALSAPRCLTSGRGHLGVSSTLFGGEAARLGGSGLRILEGFPGFLRALGSSRGWS